MLLALGSHQFDITHRAVIVGVIDGDVVRATAPLLEDADGLVAAGVDALAVDDTGAPDAGDSLATAVDVLWSRFRLPVAVRTPDAAVAQACFSAGAVVAHDESGLADRQYLRTVAAAGASIIVGCADAATPVGAVVAGLEARARAAHEAGIPADRVAVHAGPGSCEPLARAGWPVLMSDAERDPSAAGAAHAIGIMGGARIVRTRHARVARRVAEVAARLLQARDEAHLPLEAS